MASEMCEPRPGAADTTHRHRAARESQAPKSQAPDPAFGFQPPTRLPERTDRWPGLPGGMGFRSPERITTARVRQVTGRDDTANRGTSESRVRPPFQPSVPVPRGRDRWPGLPGGIGFQSPERIAAARVRMLTGTPQPETRRPRNPGPLGFAPATPFAPTRDRDTASAGFPPVPHQPTDDRAPVRFPAAAESPTTTAQPDRNAGRETSRARDRSL